MGKNQFFCWAEPNMLKFFLPELPKILTHYSYFIPTSPIIPTYSCNLHCIGDNNVHNTRSDY